MHVIVVGCGRVGAGLALELTEANHSVTIVDRRATAFDRLPASFAGERITGIGFDRTVLGRAGIDRADALAAVTSGDNSNILVARVARETFGIENVVARIYDPRRAQIYQRLGIPTVATVSWTTERVMRRLLPDVPAVDWVDPSAHVSLVERVVGSGWAGRAVADVEEDGRYRVVGVTRTGSAQLAAARLVLQDGDLVHVAVAADAMDALDHALTAPHAGGHR